ncbi:MAG: cytochrome P460 family protein [Caulobacter sp.]
MIRSSALQLQIPLAITGVIALTTALAACALDRPKGPASPIYGVQEPTGYRGWDLIAPALEDAPLDEIRVVLGNPKAVEAAHSGRLPYPDGAVLVKLAWKQKRSAQFESATVPGKATTVQVMVKDSRRYADTGGWGYGRFIGGQPVDEGQHETCHACHEARASGNDFVFTRWAP